MTSARGHLLKTFASVPPSARVLSLGPVAAADLARLGFDLWASAANVEALRQSVADVLGQEEAARRVTPSQPGELGYADDSFDWAAVVIGPADDGGAVLREVRRVLRPGAWVWVATEAHPPAALATTASDANLAVAENPVAVGDGARAIFRRVEADVGG